MLLGLGLTFGVLGLIAPSCQPAEPAMAITATPDDAKPACSDNAYITGEVDPAGATSKVVLQRTEGGKWVDWRWRSRDSDSTLGQVGATVQQRGDVGIFELPYLVPGSKSTLHLRVRSSGGGFVSKGFYVTPVC